MIPLLLRLLRNIFRWQRPEDAEGWMPFLDSDGNVLPIPADLFPQAVAAEWADARSEQAITDIVWHFDINGLRRVIALAQEEEDPDVALFTILANTNFAPGSWPEDD